MLGITAGMDLKALDSCAARCFSVAVLGHAVTCLLLSTTGAWGLTVPNNCGGPAVAVLRRCRFPVVVQRPIPMVFLLGRPWRLRSCRIFLVVVAPVVQVVFRASCPCWAFSTTGSSMCLVLATGRLSPSCEQLLVDSDMPFPVAMVSTWTTSLLSPRSFPCARRPVTVHSATWGSCKTSSCTV